MRLVVIALLCLPIAAHSAYYMTCETLPVVTTGQGNGNGNGGGSGTSQQLECTSGWIVKADVSFLPPLSISDAYSIASRIILLWVIAVGFREIGRLIDSNNHD